jgi:hypothetical protein
MFVLNYTHRLHLNNGSVITIPQGTEMVPTGFKPLWDKNGDGKRTARYYIKDAVAINGNGNNWWEISGASFHSHKVSRISKAQFAEWKATHLDTTLRMG